jgi:hypothetical protein
MDQLVNYTQSVEECYTHVAMFLLHALGPRLLTAVRHPHDKKMPSWIPDWSQNHPLGEFFGDIEDYNEKCDESAPGSGTSDDQKHIIRPFPGKSCEIGLELSVTGCRYGRIVDRSLVFQFVDIDDAMIQMKRLYYGFTSLKPYVRPEGMSDDDSIVLSHLGKTVSDGKPGICIQVATQAVLILL